MKNHSNPTIFKFEDETSGRYWYVRFVGTPDVPEWVSGDIVAILYSEVEPSDYPKYYAQIPPEWKSQKKILTPDGEQLITTLYEPGLYYLIALSQSSLAITLQKWISQEVLPSIRSTNSYSTGGVSSSEQPSTKERLETIRLGMNLLDELGGIDEQTRLYLQEQVKEILLDDKFKKSAWFSRKKTPTNSLPLNHSLDSLPHSLKMNDIWFNEEQISDHKQESFSRES
jgi:prophage antirepressor-like protein